MASKFHQAQDIQGEVIEVNRFDGTNKNTGKEWHAVDIMIEQRYPGKWNPDTRENEVWTIKLKLDRIFGSNDEIGKLCKHLKARETEEIDGVVTTIASGSEIQVKGYVSSNRFKDSVTNEWKTGSIAKVLGVSTRTFDWQYFFGINDTTSQDEEDEAPQVQRPAPKPAPVVTPSVTPTVSTANLADNLF